jgi:hypothetical protein
MQLTEVGRLNVQVTIEENRLLGGVVTQRTQYDRWKLKLLSVHSMLAFKPESVCAFEQGGKAGVPNGHIWVLRSRKTFRAVRKVLGFM